MKLILFNKVTFMRAFGKGKGYYVRQKRAELIRNRVGPMVIYILVLYELSLTGFGYFLFCKRHFLFSPLSSAMTFITCTDRELSH